MSRAAATTAPSSSSTSTVIRTGTLGVRERTPFGGRVWKSRGVVLNASTLTIHQPSRPVPLPLSAITELERTDLTDHSLSVKCAGKTYHFSFDTDGDLYDWRDDMYSRCPLGAQTTNPFNFQHTAHVGADGITGTFAETAKPIYEDLVGRSSPASQAITPAAAAAAAAGASPRSRSSTQTGSARRRSYQQNIYLSVNNNVNVEGGYLVKQPGMFLGWYWKERWLSLKDASLTIHARKTKTSSPAKEIPLSSVTSVEPDPKRSNCLFVGTTRRDTCLYILFPTDGDLYAWREAIYLRSGLSSDISMPTDFMHPIHVSYDRDTGELKGLPDQWKVDPSLVQPLVAKISMQTSGNNGRSNRRRSYPTPPRAANSEALDLSSAIASAKAPTSVPNSPAVKSPSSAAKRSRSSQSAAPSISPSTSSSPRFANLSRVPPPDPELLGVSAGSSATGTSPLSQFSAGSSLDSQNTLVGGTTPLRGSAGKAPLLSAVQELHPPSLASS